MARPLRLERAGAWYHVINRGNRRQTVFENDEDCMFDYTSIDVKIDGEEVVNYGDSYHDNGEDKVAGFLDALFFIYGKKIEVERVDIDDGPYIDDYD